MPKYTTSLHICFSLQSFPFPHAYVRTNTWKVSAGNFRALDFTSGVGSSHKCREKPGYMPHAEPRMCACWEEIS